MKLQEINKAILINDLLEMYDIENLLDLEIFEISENTFASVCRDQMNPSTYIYSVIAGNVELQQEFEQVLESYENVELK